MSLAQGQTGAGPMGRRATGARSLPGAGRGRGRGEGGRRRPPGHSGAPANGRRRKVEARHGQEGTGPQPGLAAPKTEGRAVR